MSEARERWAGRLPFVMAAVGSAVGLGNIWRFPKVVFDNGGGVFLIPYFVALITAGIPLMIVEYALGQKYQGGAPQALAAVTRKFRWVGWFALLVGTVITFYYIAIMAWAFHFTGASFNLSWAKPYQRVAYEFDAEQGAIVPSKELSAADGTRRPVAVYYQYTAEEEGNRVRAKLEKYGVQVLSAEELDARRQADAGQSIYVAFDQNVKDYFFNKTIDFHAGAWAAACAHNRAQDAAIEAIYTAAAGRELTAAEVQTEQACKDRKVSYLGHMMKPTWILFIGAAATWLAIFVIIFKGVKNVGKVVMFTVPLPVIIILIIIVRGMTLPGAWDGIAYYLTPDWNKLFDPAIWIAAYGQIFFSLSLGFGILIAYASYQPPDADITNNAFLTSFANCATSFIGGFAVFSVLGYLAFITGKPVQQVVQGGVGLAFVTYPAAIAQMGQGWITVIIGVLFFICLLSLGIDSAFSILEGVITGVKDNYPFLSKPVLTGIFCIVGFMVTAFVFCARSGLMWLDIADNWMSNYGLTLVGLFECVAIGYFADLDDLKKFINKHSEIKLHYWFDAFIKVITPSILIFLLARQLMTDISRVYGGYDAILPWSVNIAGWGLFGLLLILATIFGRNWHLLIWESAAVVCFAVFYAVFNAVGTIPNPGTIAGMTTLGAVLLLGGFFHCLYIAMTEKLPAGATPPGPAADDGRAE